MKVQYTLADSWSVTISQPGSQIQLRWVLRGDGFDARVYIGSINITNSGKGNVEMKVVSLM